MKNRNPRGTLTALARRYGRALKSLSLSLSLSLCLGALVAAAPSAWGQTGKHPLKVEKIGLGKVVSDPPGIDCGTQCSAEFAGTIVLTATPEPGWTFTWGDDIHNVTNLCRGKALVCTLKADESTSNVMANFRKEGFLKAAIWDHDGGKEFAELKPNIKGKYRIDSLPSRINILVTPSEPVGMVAYGVVMPKRNADRIDRKAPYLVSENEQGVAVPWDTLTKGNYSVEVNVFQDSIASSPILARENFAFDVKLDSNKLELRVNGKGTVSLKTKGSQCTGVCYSYYWADAKPAPAETLTATPAPGWTFTGWFNLRDECLKPVPCVMKMDADKVLGAIFKRPGFLTAVLWDLDKHKEIRVLKPSNPLKNVLDTLLLDTLPERFTILAKTEEPVPSVKFRGDLNNRPWIEFIDTIAPYSMAELPDLNPAPWNALAGNWHLILDALSQKSTDVPGVAWLSTEVYFITLLPKAAAVKPGAKPGDRLPVPRAGRRGLELTVHEAGYLDLSLIELDGRSTRLEGRVFQPGTHVLALPGQSLGKGIRHLRIAGPGWAVTRRFISME